MTDVGAGSAVKQFGMIAILNDDIAHVLLTATTSGDIPAAPAVLERRILASDKRRGFHHLRSGFAWEYGTKQDSGNLASSGGDVALGAIELGTLKDGLLCLTRIKQVEDRPLHGIEGDYLQRFAVMHEADVHIVVEVERARRLWG